MFLPSRDQWNKWSLPSKLTAIGAYVGIISIPLAIMLFALSIYMQGKPTVSPAAPPKDRAPTAADTSRNSTTVRSSANSNSSNHNTNALSTDEFLAKLINDLNSTELTNLQKAQIRKRLTGQRVQWRGYVRQTTTIGSGDSLQFLLLWSPASETDPLRADTMTATFSREHENDVSALRKNDVVVIEGTLGFTSNGLDGWLPELTECDIRFVQSK